MTLGEKIRYARKSCGLSQGQLAEKICVSRSAIAKWETDKGMPDVENLKMLSRLLNVSVDCLLDDRAETESIPIRRPINLAAYGRGCKKVKKDRLMREQFPGATITALLGRPEMAEEGQLVDSTRGFLTPVPFGTPEYMKSIRDMDRNFYLVEQETDQLFVTVTEEFLQIQPLPQQLTDQTFRLGSWAFVRHEQLAVE